MMKLFLVIIYLKKGEMKNVKFVMKQEIDGKNVIMDIIYLLMKILKIV